jgi:hypothetical protein
VFGEHGATSCVLRWLACAIATVHLVILFIFALVHEPFKNNIPISPLRWYGELTGAYTSYNFFAPAVASEVRATFVFTDQSGIVWKEEFKTGNWEVDQKIMTMLYFFPASESCDLIARSWAAQALSRHIGASQVEVIVDILQIPTLEEAQLGNALSWKPFYRGRFARRN